MFSYTNRTRIFKKLFLSVFLGLRKKKKNRLVTVIVKVICSQKLSRSLVQDIYMLHVTVTDYDSGWQV